MTSEQLDIIPATIQIIRHIRKKYACRCGNCIKTAPLANQPIPQSIASPGKASANLYSLIETAKANGLEPYAYLRVLFTELPNAATVENIEALLPGNINMDDLK